MQWLYVLKLLISLFHKNSSSLQSETPFSSWFVFHFSINTTVFPLTILQALLFSKVAASYLFTVFTFLGHPTKISDDFTLSSVISIHELNSNHTLESCRSTCIYILVCVFPLLRISCFLSSSSNCIPIIQNLRPAFPALKPSLSRLGTSFGDHLAYFLVQNFHTHPSD
jgi:hypothetical protein